MFTKNTPHTEPEPNRQQRVRVWMPTGIDGKWEQVRLTTPPILRGAPLSLKQKQEYLQLLIYQDVFKPKPLFRVIVANQKALLESRHALMIRAQETILARNKKNVLIIKKQLELLRTLADEIICEDTLDYLHSVIREYEPYVEGIEWKNNIISKTQAQAETFKEWTQTRYSKKGS